MNKTQISSNTLHHNQAMKLNIVRKGLQITLKILFQTFWKHISQKHYDLDFCHFYVLNLFNLRSIPYVNLSSSMAKKNLHMFQWETWSHIVKKDVREDDIFSA